MRFLMAIALAAGVAAAAYGAAATMTVDGGAIQFGQDVNLTCTESAQVTNWGLETSDGLVYFVRVTVDGDCAGNDLIVVVTESGIPTADGKVTLASGDSGNIPLTALGIVNTTANPRPAGSITDVHIYVEGPAGD
jgi:hypothetical protein